jgi:hypothetical protein
MSRADVHIVTHTNAFVGCDNAAQYLLVMFKTGDSNSVGLAQELLTQLDPQVPGEQNSWNCDTLGEWAAAAPHIAYIELFFHTNQAATDWFIGPVQDAAATGAMDASPSLGAAVDEHLGHPGEATTLSATSLDRYPGFGQSAEAVRRDETIAYWEAFQRELLIRECMGEAGFDYAPAVAFPAGDVREGRGGPARPGSGVTLRVRRAPGRRPGTGSTRQPVRRRPGAVQPGAAAGERHRRRRDGPDRRRSGGAPRRGVRHRWLLRPGRRGGPERLGCPV